MLGRCAGVFDGAAEGVVDGVIDDIGAGGSTADDVDVVVPHDAVASSVKTAAAAASRAGRFNTGTPRPRRHQCR